MQAVYSIQTSSTCHSSKPSQWISPQTTKAAHSSAFKGGFHANLRIIKVSIDDRIHEIAIPQEPVTCGWLLSQVQTLFNRSGPVDNDDEKTVVAVKTENSNETLDYYFTLLDR